ncbi:MAG: hypothetical protein L0H96_25625 [Humibacillus sp.]|nr:hypothetical protein [Humibacillus sp.]MDN5780258.1 hypothetical protein [Humibacillus sp.]
MNGLAAAFPAHAGCGQDVRYIVRARTPVAALVELTRLTWVTDEFAQASLLSTARTFSRSTAVSSPGASVGVVAHASAAWGGRDGDGLLGSDRPADTCAPPRPAA